MSLRFEQIRGGASGNLADAQLAVGVRVKTNGFDSAGDGGGATYLVRDPADPELPALINEVSHITLANGNIACLEIKDNLKVAQWGLKKSAIGVVGFDNSERLQTLIDFAATNSDSNIIKFKAARYNLGIGVTIPSENDGTGINSVVFQGAGRTRTELFTDQDTNLITHNDYFIMNDLFIAQRGLDGLTKYTGSGLYSAGQVRFCNFKNVNVWWFKFGTIWRFSLWNTFEQMSYNGNLCGIKLARNDDMENPDNPSPPGNWNLGDGWFHNQNTFDTIVFNGDKESSGGRGEIGFWGAVQGSNFINITAQNYERSGAIPNQTIPLGQVSTCMEIVGGGPTSSKTFNNTITDYYVERSFKALKIVDNRRLTLNSWFVQGQAGGENMLEVENSDITARGQTGQSPGFINSVKATDSNITFDKPIVASGAARDLTNSWLSESGVPIPETVRTVTATASPGVGGGTITLNPDANSIGYVRQGATVTVSGRVDIDAVDPISGDFINIDGLPFPPSNETDFAGGVGVSVTYFKGDGSTVPVSGIIPENGFSVRVYIDAATVAPLDEIYFSATYLTRITS